MENDKDLEREQVDTPSNHPMPRRDSRFWLVFLAGLVVDLLSALDLTAVSTALPTIVGHFRGSDFIWVGSAYALASTAILPAIGSLTSSLGRKPLLLGFIVFFGVGSAICGAARDMNMLIAGRVIQGLGGGGCIAVTEIVYADLVPLPERGKFQGITASVWALACAIGPPIGGALAGSQSWRWLFYLNIPLCGLAFILVFVFLDVCTKTNGFREAYKTLDWKGLSLIVSGTISISIALIRGGIQHPWGSVHILVPLIVGVACLALFVVVERRWATSPTVPPFLLANSTTLSGYIGTSLHGIVSMTALFYMPVYFQACKLDSPTRSGMHFLGLALVIPVAAILTGLSVQVVDRYRIQNYVGWTFTIVGFGILSILDVNSRAAEFVGYSVVLGIGLGIVWISTQFPILAPLPFSNNSHALAFFTFVRCFSQTWGTVIGGAILQNVLQSRVPNELLRTLDVGNASIAYALIPELQSLPPSHLVDVQKTFLEAIRIIWLTMTGISGVGLISCVAMKEVKMKKALDDTWGLKVENTSLGEVITTDEEK